MQTETTKKKAKSPQKESQNEWRWFVEPLDAHTNEVIAMMLPQRSENAMELQDSHGHTRKVWECSHLEAYKLRMSIQSKKLKLNIFTKYNGNRLELCTEPHKKFAKKRRRR